MTLQLNENAPEFSLADEKGTFHTLGEFKGKPVLIYFYPKDDTPGCTVEACNFRDDYSAYEKNDVVILGISPDSSKSHARFKEKYHLPFMLLADEKHEVCELYNVWGRKKFMGREYDGVFRTSFLIDKNGKLIKIYKDVKPAEHSKEIIENLFKKQL